MPGGRYRQLVAIGTFGAIVLGVAGGVAGAAGSTPPRWHAPDAASAAVLSAASKDIGDRYVYGAAGPTTFDCSGFTSYLWRTRGGVADIPRTAAEQQAWAVRVPADQVLPGDLVFFGRPAYHVGLSIGSGWMIDAADQAQGVIEQPIWTTRGVSYGRVPRPGMPAVRTTPTPPGSAAASPWAAAALHGAAASGPLRPASAIVRRIHRFLAYARRRVGAAWASTGDGPAYNDVGLVVAAWRAAGGRELPASLAALERAARPVSARHAVAGDLVFFGAPYDHVGIYLGHGLMIDASRARDEVVRRALLTGASVRFGQL
jgi:cell wall-associated NlpC family hydrolase